MEKMTIKQIRVGLNMTQKQMAKYLGISPVSYTNKEIGKRRFYFDEVKRIGYPNFLGVSNLGGNLGDNKEK